MLENKKMCTSDDASAEVENMKSIEENEIHLE